MAHPLYITVEVEFDHLDLLNLKTLVVSRINDLEAQKSSLYPDSIPNMLADEVIDNYKTALKRINAGIKLVEDIVKAEDERRRNVDLHSRKA